MNAYAMMSRQEAMDFLNVSEYKMKKLVREEVLTPDKVVLNASGFKVHFFSVMKLINIRRKLKKQGYHYKYD